MLVGLVAADPMVRRRLAATLGVASLEIAGAGEDSASLIARLGRSVPDVIVIAPRDGASTAAEIRAVRRRLGEVPIVALIPASDEGQGRRAISAGADGAVLDRDLDDALAATVMAAAAGQISFPQALKGTAENATLTQREKQVLSSVLAGLTNAQIADKLRLAESTVKSHLSSAFAKLGVGSRAEAAALIRDSARARDLDALASGSGPRSTE